MASKITVETPSKNSELFSRVVNFKLYPLTAHVNTASLPTKHDKRPNAHLSERRTSSIKSKLVAFNLVANAPYRFNDLFATGSGFDLITQVADVNHDRLCRNHGLLLPNSFKNIIRTENTVRMTGQQVQNSKFQRRQLNRITLEATALFLIKARLGSAWI